jgi:hypothetical protein
MSAFSVSCLTYISRCSCRIYTILQSHEDFIRVCFCTNHFYKALGLYSHMDRYCSLYVPHLMCVVYVELYCDQNDNFSPYLHCTFWPLEDYWLERGMVAGWNVWYGELGVEGVVTFQCLQWHKRFYWEDYLSLTHNQLVTDNQLNDKRTIFPINSLPIVTQCSANKDWNGHSNRNKALHIQHTLSAVHKVNSTYPHDYKIQVSYKKWLVQKQTHIKSSSDCKIIYILREQCEIYTRQDTKNALTMYAPKHK